jgi:hypothetical protein
MLHKERFLVLSLTGTQKNNEKKHTGGEEGKKGEKETGK